MDPVIIAKWGMGIGGALLFLYFAGRYTSAGVMYTLQKMREQKKKEEEDDG